MKFTEGSIKEINVSRKSITAVASSLSVDRDNEIILPRSMVKRINVYKANPVLLFGHPLRRTKTGIADPMDLIGKTTDIQISDDEVITEFEYAVDHNPRAKFIFDMAQAGFYRAYSVGGLPYGSVTMCDSRESLERALNPFGKAGAFALDQMKNGSAGLTVYDFELWEISQVFVGSNRSSLNAQKEAIEKAISGGLVSQKDISAMLRGEVPERIKSVPVAIDLAKKDGIKSLLDIPGCDKEAGAKFLESIEKDYQYYSYEPALDAVCADISARLRALANGLARSLDPDGDGDIDSIECVPACIAILESVIAQLKSLSAQAPASEAIEPIMAESKSKGVTMDGETCSFDPKDPDYDPGCMSEDDAKSANMRKILSKQLEIVKGLLGH